MKKKVFGRHFKRDANERKALFKGLLSSLIIEERIQTTEAKAKAIRPRAEKLVTRAKKGGSNVADHMREYLRGDAIEKLLAEIAPRFTKRQGGYTRILRTSRRVADNAQLAIIEWTEVGTKKAVVSQEKSTVGEGKSATAPIAQEAEVAVVKKPDAKVVKKRTPSEKKKVKAVKETKTTK